MSKAMFYKVITVSLALTLFLSPSFSRKVDGYIITNNNDTLYGEVRISKFNIAQNTVSLSSYNLDELYDHVYFKPSPGNIFKIYSPMEIVEYGFILDNVPFRYIAKEVKTRMGYTKRKFYLQVAYGGIDLFENTSPIDNQDKNHNTTMSVTEFFILCPDNNFVRVSQDDKDEPVTDFLMRYLKLDKDILDKAARNKTFKDIQEIARTYDMITNNNMKPQQ
ncbi:MAG TPA: hypothetical protein VIH57_20575 [Bacteroidales bacterium]